MRCLLSVDVAVERAAMCVTRLARALWPDVSSGLKKTILRVQDLGLWASHLLRIFLPLGFRA